MSFISRRDWSRLIYMLPSMRKPRVAYYRLVVSARRRGGSGARRTLASPLAGGLSLLSDVALGPRMQAPFPRLGLRPLPFATSLNLLPATHTPGLFLHSPI